MRLILVRHGESEANVSKTLQGLEESGLNKKGAEQASKVAESLKDENVDFVYSSDFNRARETAEKICESMGKDFICDKRLREISVGVNAGKSYDEVREEREGLGLSKFEYVHEGGESWDELRDRLNEFIEEMHDKHGDDSIMLVSHGGVFRSLLCHLFDESIEESDKYAHDNTGVTYLEKTDDGWKVVKLNCTEHLE